MNMDPEEREDTFDDLKIQRKPTWDGAKTL